MAEIKYYWSELKVDFMNSPYKSVRSWRSHTSLNVPSATSPTLKRMAKGWAREKRERINNIAEQALAKAEKNDIDKMVKALEDMKAAMVKRMNIADQLTVSDLNKLWGMIRVENGLPITIAKNENKNEDLTKEKELGVLQSLAEKIFTNANTEQQRARTNEGAA